MKSDLDTINYKMLYPDVYDCIDNHFVNTPDLTKIFNFIDNDFYTKLVKNNAYRTQLLYTGALLSGASKFSASYMSVYLFSFAISSIREVIDNILYICYALEQTIKNTDEQNAILFSSVNKIIKFYFDHMTGSPIGDYNLNKLIYHFLVRERSTMFYNIVLEHARKYKAEYVIDIILKIQELLPNEH